jgi:integrase
MSKLSILKIKSITRVGMHSDGNGLHLKVQLSKDGKRLNKSWIFRWGAQGKNSIGLGSFNDVSLGEARDIVSEYRKLVLRGINPKEQRDIEKLKIKQEKANQITFEQAAIKYIETQKAAWKANGKSSLQWTNTLTEYAYPIIGKVPCNQISKEEVLAILKPIWSEKHETATRVRGRIEKVLDWAIAMGYRSEINVAVLKSLQPLLPKISKRQIVEHHKAMHYDELPSFFKSIKDDPSISARALIFCILTATRTTESIQATWNEFDLDKKLWIIPKSRMKRSIEHRVPIASQLLALIKSIEKSQNQYLFEGQKFNKPISSMTMLKYLQRKDGCSDLTVHGFRSTFRDWAAEKANFPREVCEQALAHSLKDQVEAAYQRGDYFEKRIELMQAWADYCYGA